ncbi:MAG: glycoside hydrolase family 15 protein [Streptosporangiales bacterium]|nr:glycoside hydrolase family 15 protein [Streptosporangiales bacterium]
MPLRIEDYALIGDMQSCALVGRDGSIDWLCLPRFDSDAVFAALLGDEENGRWQIAPTGGGLATTRRYRPDTLVLETRWDTADGSVRIIDFMPNRDVAPDVVRVVEGISGRVRMSFDLRMRFDYGHIVPWVRHLGGQVAGIAGPDSVWLRTPVDTHGENFRTVAQFEVLEGQQVPFVLTWHPSHEPAPMPVDAGVALAQTEEFWRNWVSSCTYTGKYRDAVVRSLITLKALTYAPTGGITAAATTSLPETLGGERNWDYRFCWLRDATVTLEALMRGGYTAEAGAWRTWLLRAIAGSPQDIQIMYGVAGERRIDEYELPWLSGYEGSQPVRVGNAAAEQVQHDVFGEVMSALHLGRLNGLQPDEYAWAIQRALVNYIAERWQEPDQGLWEMRGEPRHFVHSKVMIWVALDRAIRTVEESELDGPLDKWRAVRDDIHAEVCEKGWDPDKRSFTQAYGSSELDASLLLIPQVGFLPPSDERVIGTVEAIQRELTTDGFVARYDTVHTENIDGLAGEEGTFLMCSFWLADDLQLIGRTHDARELFEKLLEVRNDVGLLAEEYDLTNQRLVGNFPQAFSHTQLIRTAYNLSEHDMTHRSFVPNP